jgi:hypothetical protein
LLGKRRQLTNTLGKGERLGPIFRGLSRQEFGIKESSVGELPVTEDFLPPAVTTDEERPQ